MDAISTKLLVELFYYNAEQTGGLKLPTYYIPPEYAVIFNLATSLAGRYELTRNL